jgi:hypothetical protein
MYKWEYKKTWYDQKLQQFMECFEIDNVKVFLGYDYGVLRGVYGLDGQNITSLICDDIYTGLESHIESHSEAA